MAPELKRRVRTRLPKETLEGPGVTGEVVVVGAGQQSPYDRDACVFVDGSASDPGSQVTPWRVELVAPLRGRWAAFGRHRTSW